MAGDGLCKCGEPQLVFNMFSDGLINNSNGIVMPEPQCLVHVSSTERREFKSKCQEAIDKAGNAGVSLALSNPMLHHVSSSVICTQWQGYHY
jgi:hypothetical protein